MKKIIDEFLEQKHIAIAGVSRNKNKWGNGLMKELQKKGIRIYPVNPFADELEGEKCYHDVKSLPAEVESLIIATKPGDTEIWSDSVRIQESKGYGCRKEPKRLCFRGGHPVLQGNNIPYVRFLPDDVFW
jgi:hypothetical protein